MASFSECKKTGLVYTLDTTAPTTPQINILFPRQAIAKDRNLEFQFSVEQSATYQLFEDDKCDNLLYAFEASLVVESFEAILDGADGEYPFHYIATDKLGNRSNCRNSDLVYTLDTIAPRKPDLALVSEELNPDGPIEINYPNPIISLTGIEEYSYLKLFVRHEESGVESSEESFSCENPLFEKQFEAETKP